MAPGSLPLYPQLEDAFVASMNSTRTGTEHDPGDAVAVDGWPGVAPGTRGVLNTMAPTVFDLAFPDVGHSPHVERPQEFTVALLEHLDVPAEAPASLR